jgi:hypothetical protein
LKRVQEKPGFLEKPGFCEQVQEKPGFLEKLGFRLQGASGTDS